MSDKYELVENGVLDLERTAFIPNDERNTDWQDFLQWQSEGNIPRQMKPSPFHSWDGTQWVEDTAAAQTSQNQQDIERLMQVDKVTLRLLIALTKKLLEAGVIQPTDFSQAERDLYQQVKTLKETMFS